MLIVHTLKSPALLESTMTALITFVIAPDLPNQLYIIIEQKKKIYTSWLDK